MDILQQIAFFNQRLPRLAYAMDQLGPMALMHKAKAIECRYVQHNPKTAISVLTFDIDRMGGAMAWADANLPPPNLAVINPRNAHAHLSYFIETPVFLGEGKALTKAAQLLRTVQRGITHQLGADPAYSNFTTKNPNHPAWHTTGFRAEPYSLLELIEWLSPEALKYGNERPAPQREIGLGRNVALFDLVRVWAYRWVMTYKETASYGQWFDFVLAQAMERNREFTYPLQHPEVRHTARSITRWTWDRFNAGGFLQAQSRRGKVSGEARTEKAQARIRTALESLAESGNAATTKSIAEAAHLSPRQARRHRKAECPIYPDMVHVRTGEHPAGERVQRIIELRASGLSFRAVAAQAGVGVSYVHRIIKAQAATTGADAGAEDQGKAEGTTRAARNTKATAAGTKAKPEGTGEATAPTKAQDATNPTTTPDQGTGEATAPTKPATGITDQDRAAVLSMRGLTIKAIAAETGLSRVVIAEIVRGAR